MTKYVLTMSLEVEGPEWPHDTVPKHLWDFPEGVMEQLEDEALAHFNEYGVPEIVSVEVGLEGM